MFVRIDQHAVDVCVTVYRIHMPLYKVLRSRENRCVRMGLPSCELGPLVAKGLPLCVIPSLLPRHFSALVITTMPGQGRKRFQKGRMKIIRQDILFPQDDTFAQFEVVCNGCCYWNRWNLYPSCYRDSNFVFLFFVFLFSSTVHRKPPAYSTHEAQT